MPELQVTYFASADYKKNFAESLKRQLQELEKMTPEQRAGYYQKNARHNDEFRQSDPRDIMTRITRDNVTAKADFTGIAVTDYFPSVSHPVPPLPDEPVGEVRINGVNGISVKERAKKFAEALVKQVKGGRHIQESQFDVDGSGKVDTREEMALVEATYNELEKMLGQKPEIKTALEDMRSFGSLPYTPADGAGPKMPPQTKSSPTASKSK